MIAAIAELFFLSDGSDNSDLSDHMETRLNGLRLYLESLLFFFIHGLKTF